MLKNKKDHHVPTLGSHKHHQIKNLGGYVDYDPLHDLNPFEVAKEKMNLVKEWMNKTDEIILGLLIGSYARGEQREDSDVDYIIMVNDMDPFMEDTHWVSKFGEVVSIQKEVYEEVTALRVYYSEDIELEFGFVSEDWYTQPLKEATKEALNNGKKVLKDIKKLL